MAREVTHWTPLLRLLLASQTNWLSHHEQAVKVRHRLSCFAATHHLLVDGQDGSNLSGWDSGLGSQEKGFMSGLEVAAERSQKLGSAV